MKIKAYLKPTCGWSRGVRAMLAKYDLAYEDLNIIEDPSLYAEMVERSGQHLSPCVEVDGIMLSDVSGDEVEAYLLANGLVQPNERVPEAPTDQCCSGPAEPKASPSLEKAEATPGDGAVRFF